MILKRLQCTDGTYRNAVSALLKAGLIETVRPGGRNHPAQYRFAARDALQCHNVNDTDRNDTDALQCHNVNDTDGVSVSQNEGQNCDTETGYTLLSSKESPNDDDDHQSINQEGTAFAETLKAGALDAGLVQTWDHSAPRRCRRP